MSLGPHQPGPGGNQKPFKIIPSPFAASHPTTESTSPSNRTTPQRNVKPLFRISTTYSTIAARAISFQRQLLTGITPHQLAQNGLYHQVRAGVGDTACCFTCEIMVPLKAIQGNPTGNLSKIHKEDCLWQVICHDLKPFLPSPSNHTGTPSSATRSTQITALESNIRPEPHPAPTAPTPVNQAETDLESPAESSPARLETEPLASRPATCPPQPIQLTRQTRDRTVSIATSPMSSTTHPTNPDNYLSPQMPTTYLRLCSPTTY